MSNLHTSYYLKLYLKNMDQHPGGKSLIHRSRNDTTGTISHKSWNSSVENPNRQYKFDIKLCYGNIKDDPGIITSLEMSNCSIKIA